MSQAKYIETHFGDLDERTFLRWISNSPDQTCVNREQNERICSVIGCTLADFYDGKIPMDILTDLEKIEYESQPHGFGSFMSKLLFVSPVKIIDLIKRLFRFFWGIASRSYKHLSFSQYPAKAYWEKIVNDGKVAHYHLFELVPAEENAGCRIVFSYLIDSFLRVNYGEVVINETEAKITPYFQYRPPDTLPWKDSVRVATWFDTQPCEFILHSDKKFILRAHYVLDGDPNPADTLAYWRGMLSGKPKEWE